MSISSVNGSSGTVNRYTYNAVGGETSISGTDSNGATISYLVGKEEVYVNGVLLVRTADYTATNGATITLVSALVAGDVIEIVTFSSFAIPTAISSATVATKGDLIVGTGASTVTNLPVGADGTTLVANSASATGMAWAGPTFTAGKNKIINGDFGIWQRGTSFSVNASFVYTADRWATYGYSGTTTISQQVFTAGTAPVAGYESSYFLRMSATNTQTQIEQRIEDVRTLAGQTVTLSFWAKAASAVSLSSSLQQNFGSGGSSTVYTSNSNVSLTTSWQKFSVTSTLPSLSGKTIGSSNFLSVFFNYSGTGVNIDLWGVQLEAGSVATPFTTATGTLQGELAACQRYYQRITSAGGGQILNIGYGYSGTLATASIPSPVTMRVAATSVDSSGVRVRQAGIIYSGGTITIDTSTPNITSVDYTHGTSVFTNTGTASFELSNAGNYIGFSAEL